MPNRSKYRYRWEFKAPTPFHALFNQFLEQGEDEFERSIPQLSGKNSYVRCQFVSAQGQECDEWFQVDGGKFCPKYHRESSITDNKENFISLMNSERELCYRLSNENLEIHIREIEARIEAFVQTERTKLASARAVRAERYEKMSEDERKELRKIQISKDPNGSKKATPKPKQDKGTVMANKLGVSRQDLLDIDPDNMEAFKEKYRRGKE